MTGSYIDNIITGSILATPLGDPSAVGVRKIQASVAAGQAGTTGSLQRFVRLTDTSGKMYDSFPPNFLDLLLLNGKTMYSSGGQYYISVSTPDTTLTRGIDTEWWLRHAYDQTSARFVENSHVNFTGFAYDASNVATSAPVKITFPYTLLVADLGLAPGQTSILVTDNQGAYQSASSFPNVLRALFGFGDNKVNAPTFNRVNDFYMTPNIRGYKYGLAGLFGSAMGSRWRRDRYGQFRDMLEQRQYPALLQRGGTVEYPVTVTFVSREGGITSPEKTHSQNLSPYVTSSLPYYDGLVKERTDNPDNTLRPVEIEASSS